ncbi:Nramp family divalent metal transporter [Rhizosphaericola mali]|uniref:Divalent metal cation transporter MntH n=1 Tax=Rhizosphaericola mali TaxID=2545455 RepID=A0A5P2G1U9_9BACT|nr:Nramp family divalent metal transporter [Rhizosphaericola mali]QES87820.1 iron/manganese transporter [Rhizosphaericola mali]
METKSQNKQSLSLVHETIDTTIPKKGFRKILAFFGPAYLVSVGYMDPGNWATDLQGGSQFGYKLIWILLLSNLMALLLQGMAARLGIVRRRDLAQANREEYPKVVNFLLYILAELAIAACDLAEVLGMAIGLNLLCGLPVIWGVTITVCDTFLLFYLEKLGMRKMEAFIIVLISIIGFSFLTELIFAKPHMGDVIKGFIPTKLSGDALYISIGIIGATVMPHNLYLHSALVQTRKISSDRDGILKAIKFNRIDSTIALNAAFFVNAAILILAGAIFYTSGHQNIAKIEDAYKLLEPMMGSFLAPTLFAIALIASGQSSTVTGTLAGQIVMEGYLHLRINPLLRRLITRIIAIVPAYITIIFFGEKDLDELLVFSQVILSLQLGFAIIPLIHFVSDKKKMGEFAIGPKTKIVAWMIAILVVYLNSKLVYDSISSYLETPGNIPIKLLIGFVALGFVILFIIMTFHPIIKKKFGYDESAMSIHGPERQLIEAEMTLHPLKKIAIALDFAMNDEIIIANALKQGGKDAVYYLIHITETPSAKYSGYKADDFETEKDKNQIDLYVNQLREMGFEAEGLIGYKNRVNEIVRLVKTYNADLLVLGSHNHKGIMDWIYGETVDKVRHKLSVPVLVVNK